MLHPSLLRCLEAPLLSRLVVGLGAGPGQQQERTADGAKTEQLKLLQCLHVYLNVRRGLRI
jgi:hypothetical protein